MPGVAYPDYAHARLIVVWGANPSASGIHLVPVRPRGAGKRAPGSWSSTRGARRSPSAPTCTWRVRPGTDLCLALAVIRWLFANGRADERFLAEHTTGAERAAAARRALDPRRAARATGLAAADIEAFARLYADSRPALVRCGWGLERNRNGGSAVAAVLALPAVAGKFGVRGGGYTLSNSAAWDLDARTAIVRAPSPRPARST